MNADTFPLLVHCCTLMAGAESLEISYPPLVRSKSRWVRCGVAGTYFGPVVAMHVPPFDGRCVDSPPSANKRRWVLCVFLPGFACHVTCGQSASAPNKCSVPSTSAGSAVAQGAEIDQHPSTSRRDEEKENR